MSERFGMHFALCWWFGHHRSGHWWNQPLQVWAIGGIWDEEPGGPSPLPRDRSDPNPRQHIDQSRHYVLNMLYKFCMMDCRSVTTPLDRNTKLRYNSVPACDDKRFWHIVWTSEASSTWQSPKKILAIQSKRSASSCCSWGRAPLVRAQDIAPCQRHEGSRDVVWDRHSRTINKLYGCKLGRKCQVIADQLLDIR